MYLFVFYTKYYKPITSDICQEFNEGSNVLLLVKVYKLFQLRVSKKINQKYILESVISVCEF